MERGHMCSDFFIGLKVLTVSVFPTGVLFPEDSSSFMSFFFLRKSNCLGFTSSFPLPLLVLSQSFFYTFLFWFDIIGWNGGVLCMNLNFSSKRPPFPGNVLNYTDSRLLWANFCFFTCSPEFCISSSLVPVREICFVRLNWVGKASPYFPGNFPLIKGALSQLFLFWEGNSYDWARSTCLAIPSNLLSPPRVGLPSLLFAKITDCVVMHLDV